MTPEIFTDEGVFEVDDSEPIVDRETDDSVTVTYYKVREQQPQVAFKVRVRAGSESWFVDAERNGEWRQVAEFKQYHALADYGLEYPNSKEQAWHFVEQLQDMNDIYVVE